MPWELTFACQGMQHSIWQATEEECVAEDVSICLQQGLHVRIQGERVNITKRRMVKQFEALLNHRLEIAGEKCLLE